MFKLPAIGQKVKGQNLNRKSLQQIADEQAALDAKQTGQPQSSPSKPAVAHAKQESPPLPGADASEAAVAAAEKKSKPESSEEKSTPRMESNSSSKLYEVIYQKYKKLEELKGNIIATISVLYNKEEKNEELFKLQHEFSDMIMAYLHSHLTETSCLEVMVIKGSSNRLKKLVDGLK